MHSLVDFHSFGGIVNINQSVFQSFKKCGAIISNHFYPDTNVFKNLEINSSQFGSELGIDFNEEKYSQVLAELADTLSIQDIDFDGFSECEEDSNANPPFPKCFQIQIQNSEFLNLNNNLNVMGNQFYKTGADFADSVVPQFTAYFMALHKYEGSLIIQNNQFLYSLFFKIFNSIVKQPLM